MIDENLIAYIAAMNTAAGARVHTGSAPPEQAYPLIVVRRSGGSSPRSLNGRALFERADFDFNTLASDYPDAFAVSRALKARFDGMKGISIGSTSVKSCRCVLSPIDQSVIDGDKVHRWVVSTYRFVYSEA